MEHDNRNAKSLKNKHNKNRKGAETQKAKGKGRIRHLMLQLQLLALMPVLEEQAQMDCCWMLLRAFLQQEDLQGGQTALGWPHSKCSGGTALSPASLCLPPRWL